MQEQDEPKTFRFWVKQKKFDNQLTPYTSLFKFSEIMDQYEKASKRLKGLRVAYKLFELKDIYGKKYYNVVLDTKPVEVVY